MRLRSATKFLGGRQKGPLLKKSSIQPLDKMPIVVLDSLIDRLDPKSLLALKNTNRNFARAIKSNRLRLWKRFWAVNVEIIDFFRKELALLGIKLSTFALFLFGEGRSDEANLILRNGSVPLQKIQDKMKLNFILEPWGHRLRNSWKKDAGKFRDMQKNIIDLENTLESLQQTLLSLPASEEIKIEVSCFRQKVPQVKAKVAHCQSFCILLSSYFR